MSNELTFNRQRLTQVFFFSVFALLLWQLFQITRPFLTALLMAAMLAMGFYPLYARLRRKARNPNVAAFILTFAVMLAAVLPLIFIGWLVFREADKLLPTFQNFMAGLQHMDANTLRDKLPGFLSDKAESILNMLRGMEMDPDKRITGFVGGISGRISDVGSFIARNFLLALFNAIVLFIALFFAFRDGEVLLNWFLSLVPMEATHKNAIAKRAYETFMAVVMGVFLTASAQGLTAMIGFFIAGVRLPVLLGVATAVISMLGASIIVTLPVALATMKENTTAGIFLLFWGFGVVGLMDNILKPILIGSRARMPFVLIFFSIVGGLKAYGFLGVILGPILMASVLTFISIYRRGFDGKNKDLEGDFGGRS